MSVLPFSSYILDFRDELEKAAKAGLAELEAKINGEHGFGWLDAYMGNIFAGPSEER